MTKPSEAHIPAVKAWFAAKGLLNVTWDDKLAFPRLLDQKPMAAPVTSAQDAAKAWTGPGCSELAQARRALMQSVCPKLGRRFRAT